MQGISLPAENCKLLKKDSAPWTELLVEHRVTPVSDAKIHKSITHYCLRALFWECAKFSVILNLLLMNE